MVWRGETIKGSEVARSPPIRSLGRLGVGKQRLQLLMIPKSGGHNSRGQRRQNMHFGDGHVVFLPVSLMNSRSGSLARLPIPTTFGGEAAPARP